MSRYRQRWIGAALAVVVVSGVLVGGPGRAQAFAPDGWHSLGDASHVSITEQAFRALAKEYFSITKLTRQMRAAMEELTDANVAVDDNQYFSEPHFDGENFVGGQNRLVERTQLTEHYLKWTPPKATEARDVLGQGLHTVQDFYTHTNWVELGNTGANPDLGRAGRTLGPVAGPTEPTCNGSELITNKLTSGYYGGEDRKPQIPTKCRHGGPLDLGPGTGGISKDFSDGAMSPHSAHHGAAVAAAVAGTILYIRNIAAKLTVTQRRALFGVGSTLAMAVDTTASMAGILGEVKAQAASLVDARVGTPQEPLDYVLTAFGDTAGGAFRTEDPDAFKQALNALGGNGGGDCPEASMAGMSQAIQASADGSEVFLFTDADPIDEHLRDANIQAARSKDIRVSSMIFGDCGEPAVSKAGKQQGGESSENEPAKAEQKSGQGQSQSAVTGRRVTASAAATDAYRMVARETGGHVFDLAYDNAGDIAKLVDQTSTADSATALTSEVTLADEPIVLAVPVDSTMRKVTFLVNGAGHGTKAALTRPDGTVVGSDDEGVESISVGYGGTMLIVDRPQVGEWTLTIEGTGRASVRVSADSDLDLDTFEFVSPGTLDPQPSHQAVEPVNQLPLPGPVAVHAVLSEAVESAGFEFRDTDGAVLSKFTLPRQGTEFAGTTTLPKGSPVIYVRGEDATGAAFQRLITKPLGQSSTDIVLTPSTPEPILPGAVSRRTVTVMNLGPAATFDVTVDSSVPVSRASNPAAVDLATGESVNVDFDVALTREAGGHTTLTFVARERGSTRNVTVLEQRVRILEHPDQLRPVVTATSDPEPGPDGKFTDAVTVRLNATDASGVAEIAYVTGETNAGDKTVVRDSSQVDVPIRNAGLTRLWYQATDSTGLASEWEHIDIDIDIDAYVPTWSTTPGGQSVRAGTTVPGQTAEVVFPGRAGQRVSMDLRDSDYRYLSVSLRDPSGTVLATRDRCYDRTVNLCFLGPVTLPVDGVFALVLDPVEDSIGSIAVRVFETPEDPVVPITLDGMKRTLATTAAGQRAGFSFTGKAGWRVSMLAGDVTFAGDTELQLQLPNGDTVPVTGSLSGSPGKGFFGPTTLPDDGQYTVWVDPEGGSTGSVTLQVYDVPADVSQRIEPDSSPVTVQTVPGQIATLTFAGRAGRRMSLMLSDGTIRAGGVTVYRPDGSSLLTSSTCATRCPLVLPTLEDTGDYRVAFQPGVDPMTMTVELFDVTADATATVIVDARPPVVTSRPGQNVTLSFDGTAGQKVTLLGSLSDYSGYPWGLALLRDPDGEVLTSVRWDGGSLSLIAFPLPVTGRYTVTIDPYGDYSGRVELGVSEVG